MTNELSQLAPIPPVQQVAVVDTTELRFFADGPLPTRISGWFTHYGEVGVRDERCDTYRLDGREDVGIKLRCRQILELKVRQAVGAQLQLGAGLTGDLEVWRKWSPAHSLVERNDDPAWVEVHKAVIKRRFSVEGVECTSVEDAALLTGGVDVELAAVAVEGIDAWTIAFAGFGPPGHRVDAIVTASRALLAATGAPEPGLVSSRSCGYPYWLMKAVSHRVETPSRPLELRAVQRSRSEAGVRPQ